MDNRGWSLASIAHERIPFPELIEGRSTEGPLDRWDMTPTALHIAKSDVLSAASFVLYAQKSAKIVGGRNSAPDPTGGAHGAPPDPLIVWFQSNNWPDLSRIHVLKPCSLYRQCSAMIGCAGDVSYFTNGLSVTSIAAGRLALSISGQLTCLPVDSCRIWGYVGGGCSRRGGLWGGCPMLKAVNKGKNVKQSNFPVSP